MSEISRLIVEQARAAAEARRQSGAIWGTTVTDVGNNVARIVQQQTDPARQLAQLQVADATRTRAGQAKVADLLTARMPNGPQPEGAGPAAPQSAYLGEDGLYDVPNLTKALAASGFADKAPELLKSAEAINDSILKHQDIEQKSAQAKVVMFGDLADGIVKATKAGIPFDQAFDFATMPAVATKRFTAQELAATKTQLLALPPDQQQAALGRLMDAAAKVSGGKTLGKDAQELDRYGRVIASNDAPKAMTPAEQAQRYETERHNRESERISALTEGRTEAAQKETARHNLASEAIDAKRAVTDKLTKVEHKDPTTGRTVIEWLPQSEIKGKTFQKGTGGTTETRLASAEAVTQTGNDIIAKLSDPAYTKALGPVLGRYSKLQDFIGNPPPEYAELAGAIESYSLANMGVHGMRSAQGAQQIAKLLNQPHTPESMVAAIKGLNKFSEHFMQNEGRTGAAPAAAATGGLTVTDPNGGVHTFTSQADANKFKAAAGIK